MLENNNITQANKILKSNLSTKTINLIGVFTMSTSMVLGFNKDAIGKNIDISANNSRGEDLTEMLYEDFRNDISFEIHGFIKTIEIKHPYLVNDMILRDHEERILNVLSGFIQENILNISLNLSKENIQKLSLLIKSISSLLDTMYGEGYSNILTDGQDHSNKNLIIDIREVSINHYELKKISIENNIDL